MNAIEGRGEKDTNMTFFRRKGIQFKFVMTIINIVCIVP